jgi:hypothetical protein
MRKTVMVMVIVAALMAAAGIVFASPQAEKVSYTGFLMDKACLSSCKYGILKSMPKAL